MPIKTIDLELYKCTHDIVTVVTNVCICFRTLVTLFQIIDS